MENTTTQHPTRRLLTLREVEQRTGYRKSKLYASFKARAFPQPVRLDTRSIRFVESEVDEWIAARIAERDAKVPDTQILVTEEDVAAAVGLSVSYLQKDRLSASPRVPFLRVGPHIRYNLAAVREAMGMQS